MKSILYFLSRFIRGWLFFHTTFLCAQNLVSNPGFENLSGLPNNPGQWNLATGWSNCNGTGSPDLFHMLGSGQVDMPATFASYLTPHSGDAVMGFSPYYAPNVSDFREYISSNLISPWYRATHMK
jgi:hypothetical protein